MKAVILSDIHGSAYYAEKALEIIRKENPDVIFLLGDILYHGPRNDLPRDYAPKKVISLLNPLKEKILCVQGNCDAEVDQMVLDFPIQGGTVRTALDGLTVRLSHGHHVNSENPPADMKPGDILLTGHTHVPAWEEKDGMFFLNPGSTSIPKEKSPHSLIVYGDHVFDYVDLDSRTVYHTLKIQ